MIKVLGKIPDSIYIAASGGLDSMACLDFLSRSKGRNIEVLHFNHGTEHSNKAEALVKKVCLKAGLKLTIGNISSSKTKGESQEEYWRRERYTFFNQFGDRRIITCHHLNDQVENYIFTMLNGNEMLIPYKRGNFIRPFLSTKRVDLESWAENKNVDYIEDPSNFDTRYSRNLIRHNIIPMTKIINPGIEKVIKKKVIRSFSSI